MALYKDEDFVTTVFASFSQSKQFLNPLYIS